MSEQFEYDVIVIGAGLGGGLPCSAYLQKAGAKVLMVEAGLEGGCHVKTNEFWPGALNTPCAAGSFVGNSPAMEDLELEDYGVQLRLGPRGTGCIFPNHTNLFLGLADVPGTVADIAKFSEKDAKRAEPIFQRILETLVEVNGECFYSIMTPQKLNKMYDKLSYVWGCRPEDFAEMNAFELVERTFERDEVRQTIMTVATVQTFGDIGEPGQGAFSVPIWMYVIPAQLKGGNHSLAHALIRVYLEHGGDLWRNSPVERIITENGVATGIKMADSAVMHPGQTIRAKRAVVSNAGAKNTLELIGEDIMTVADPLLAMRMKHWDNASRASCVTTWVLKGQPKWKNIAWNPIVTKQHFFYKACADMDELKAWYMAQKSGDIWRALNGYGEVVIPSAVDETQSLDGILTMRCEEVLPFWFRGEDGLPDPEQWDTRKREITEKRTDMWESLAPGFRDQVLKVMDVSPLDLWRGNMAAEYGNGIGGGYVGNQWMFERLPYRMPIKNLYSSNSVWPISLSWLATGYNAACAVAEDMGIRKQPWWIHRPCEYTLKNIERLSVTNNPHWVD